MAHDEAVALIDELSATIIKEEFIYRHKWQVGDVLMWDNCAVQHLAIHDYALPLRRMMWRITVGSLRFMSKPKPRCIGATKE